MTVQNVTAITDTSADDVSVPGPRDARCVDVTPDRSPREPTGGGTVRSRDVATAVLPEHQLRTRFRHVYAGRRYAAPGRLAGQSGTSKVFSFSCVTSRYRTDLLRRLKEARYVDALDHTAPPDARRPGDWLGGRGVLARAATGQAGSRQAGQRSNVEQSGVNVERRHTHGLALAPADRVARALGRNTVEFSRASDGSPRLDETTAAAPVNAGTSTSPPMTYGRTSSAAAAETVCSCPAVCRGHDADQTQTERPYTGLSHPARLRMKLSSRLSHEAQCAINETRRDMGVSLVGSDSVSDDKAKETTSTTSTSTTDSVKTTGARPDDVTAPAPSEGTAVGQHYCITPRQAHAKDSIYKIRLSKHPDNTHENTHNNTDGGLPALTSLAVDTAALNVFSSGQGTTTYNNTCLLSLSQCYRAVPLLRKAREQTFEITPPWYDSRYTDYPAPPPLFAPMEPPKDIKAQAVAKCRDWINKYL